MQHIDPTSLNDLPTRVKYLRDFIGFTTDDAAALHAAAPVVAPLVPVIVDAVYNKLYTFDITWKAFLPPQTGFTGKSPEKLDELTIDHAHITFRKDFLKNYLVKLVTLDYEKPSTWQYLDKVGLMHTGEAGFAHRKHKSPLRIEYIHCSALLGYVQDIIVNAVLDPKLELPIETKTAVLRAVNKILWIQNDLFARHYIKDEPAPAPGSATL